jgi:membrane protein involved in colicin uptake
VKDAESLPDTGGLRIKDAELFEVSVVSVPCNQGATFSLAKSFDSMEDYEKFKKSFVKETNSVDSVKTEETEQSKVAKAKVNEENRMSEEKKAPESFDLDAFAKEVAEKAAAKVAMQQAEIKAAEEKAAKEAAEQAAQIEAEQKAQVEADQEKQKEVVVSVMTGAEKLMSDVEQRVSEKHESLETVVKELQSELREKSEEIMKIRESKRLFSDRGSKGDMSAHEKNITDAKVLGLATGKGWDTTYGRSVMEKANADSGVGVPAAASTTVFETIASTTIERDIQNELVLAPLFREIEMTSANMVLPILPDAGYAEFTSNQAASGSSPHGNLEERGDTYGSPYAGVDLTTKILTTQKLISQSYIGNETEEDAILPILPLIRESMVRAHARGIENALLLGNDSEGNYSSGAFNGLITNAKADDSAGSHVTADTGGGANGVYSASLDKLVATDLLGMRKNMGKYGVNPAEVVYIVSQEGYYNLLEDGDFQDVNLVGDLATKLSGEIGTVFGSRVLLCDEFAGKDAGKFLAVAVNPRNYVMPRLRGVTIESDYEVAAQRRVLVASQRLGFEDIINGATSVHAFKYAASS